MAAFTAFYDANVLYPAELRNLLMHLALTGLFEPSGRRMSTKNGSPLYWKSAQT